MKRREDGEKKVKVATRGPAAQPIEKDSGDKLHAPMSVSETATVSDREDVLPVRFFFFATDRFSSERVNMYSTFDYILAVRDTLDSTAEMRTFLGSCFSGLFKIPARTLLMGRVVHGMMVRQLVMKKKFEMWPISRGKPLRFLVEFGKVTGLPCGEFEDGSSIDYQLPQKEENYEYWDRLIGSNQDVTIEDLVGMIDTEKEMPRWRKLRLCLLIIVDGVLVETFQKPRPTLKYVKLVENLKEFLPSHGDESLFVDNYTLKPPERVMGKCDDPIGDFCKKLEKKTVKTVGFSLSLQLVAFHAIPQLLAVLMVQATMDINGAYEERRMSSYFTVVFQFGSILLIVQ
ncbi:LOW QUALITY PROTEIN: hypothetical protein N665_0049s0028 [Sinapis alba]|nr:LOW QUALITY PROTEIN: hypothetical protein N665_0049s0028 [Sinapis alba]